MQAFNDDPKARGPGILERLDAPGLAYYWGDQDKEYANYEASSFNPEPGAVVDEIENRAVEMHGGSGEVWGKGPGGFNGAAHEIGSGVSKDALMPFTLGTGV